MLIEHTQNMFRHLQREIHQNAVDHGWYDEPRSFGDIIALCHSELSEALEGFRNGNPPDKHCPEISNVEIELADVVIRIMDYCGASGIDLAAAILAKHEFNKTRSYKHGGKAI